MQLHTKYMPIHSNTYHNTYHIHTNTRSAQHTGFRHQDMYWRVLDKYWYVSKANTGQYCQYKPIIWICIGQYYGLYWHVLRLVLHKYWLVYWPVLAGIHWQNWCGYVCIGIYEQIFTFTESQNKCRHSKSVSYCASNLFQYYNMHALFYINSWAMVFPSERPVG